MTPKNNRDKSIGQVGTQLAQKLSKANSTVRFGNSSLGWIVSLLGPLFPSGPEWWPTSLSLSREPVRTFCNCFTHKRPIWLFVWVIGVTKSEKQGSPSATEWETALFLGAWLDAVLITSGSSWGLTCIFIHRKIVLWYSLVNLQTAFLHLICVSSKRWPLCG